MKDNDNHEIITPTSQDLGSNFPKSNQRLVFHECFFFFIPTEEEAREYYDSRPDLFTSEEMVSASHILKKASSDEAFENAEKEILLIGNWCISEKNEKYLRKLNYSVCKSYLETNSDIKKSYEKCENIYESIIKDISLRLNEKLTLHK